MCVLQDKDVFVNTFDLLYFDPTDTVGSFLFFDLRF